MPIKSKSVENPKQDPYPKLMRSKRNDFVILVTKCNASKPPGVMQTTLVGTVVYSSEADQQVGYHSVEWAGECFKDTSETVELTNL